MNCDGEKVVLVGLDGCIVWYVEPEIGFGVELHKDVAGSTLRSLSRREIHLSDGCLRIVSYDAIIVHKRKRPCRHRPAENNIISLRIITLTILSAKVRQRDIHRQRHFEMYNLQNQIPVSFYR